MTFSDSPAGATHGVHFMSSFVDGGAAALKNPGSADLVPQSGTFALLADLWRACAAA